MDSDFTLTIFAATFNDRKGRNPSQQKQRQKTPL